MTKNLSWLNSVLYEKISQGLPIEVSEINIDGSWECGKTYACIEETLLCLSCPNVACVYIRNTKFQINELTQSVLTQAKSKDIAVIREFNTDYPTYKVVDTQNYFRFVYLERKNKQARDYVLSGFAPFRKVKYILILIDEAVEVPNKTIPTILSKIRGEKDTQVCLLRVCNPYSLSFDYIKYMNENLPYNRAKLMKYGFDVKKIGSKIFAHINVLGAKDIVNDEKMKLVNHQCALNKRRAMTIKYGLPSYDEESCYGSVLENINMPFVHNVDRIVCGVDTAFGTERHAGITACFIGFYKKGIGVDFFNEYTQDNRFGQKKSITQRANEIIDFVYNQLREYRIKLGNTIERFPYVYINVDCSSGDFIDRLNELIYNRRLGRVMCARPNQKQAYKINERINLLVDWIINRKIRIDFDKCKILFDEMNTLKLIKPTTPTEPTKRESNNDHCVNALEYAMEDIWELEEMEIWAK